ncbi:MAG: enoyl-CoA hydratase-related protein [Pseudomonadota bacterium]
MFKGEHIVFQGQTIQLSRLAGGIVELCFDRPGADINKLDQLTIREWGTATNLIAAAPDVRGVLVTSGKSVFIVGADINEFGATFKLPAAELSAATLRSNEVANAFEDLPVPSVVAINGFALGGGLEVTLCAALRVMSTAAQVGLPEVKLGLYPGLGGTVRMTRIAGPAIAIDWIASGKPHQAAAALEAGVVDEICAPELLREAALACLSKAAAGEIDWRARQERKRKPLEMDAKHLHAAFKAGRAAAAAASAPHQPAASIAVDMMEQAATRDRAGALALEADSFAAVAKTQAAGSLIQIFHNEQTVRKLARQHLRNAPAPVGGTAGARAGMPVLLTEISGQPMLLAEVIKGSNTSDGAVSAAVAQALEMGQTPIVVKDSPGFLVNRILVSYMRAFVQLLADGADFAQVDRVMEAFGWPMGPAALADLIGIDTLVEVSDVIAASHADRMPPLRRDALRLMVEHKRHGQKNGIGFYSYGQLKRSVAPDTRDLLRQIAPAGRSEFTDEVIIERMLLPLLIEAAHALEEGVVATAAELDMALLLGIGFPRYLGGALKYADWLGLATVVRLAAGHASCRVTKAMLEMAASGGLYYPEQQAAANENLGELHETE